ncbi:MAG: SLC13 family permease [Bacteroidales bacterium]
MDHTYVFIVLGLVLVLFAWGKIRHDLVALLALFALVVPGIVAAEKAFSGFGHPAVITVAAVLIIGKGLEYSGLIDVLGKWITGIGNNMTLQILALSFLVAAASAFMNNVGALAILMPVVLHIAAKSGNPPSFLLMPIAFASLLGGMTTLIGTPPNIIISTLRADETGEAFGMFAFAPVGLGLTIAGIIFIAFAGWRLLPKREAQKSEKEAFRIDDYITEVKVGKDSKAAGISVGELRKIADADVQVLGLVRKKKRIHAPEDEEELLKNDIVIIEGDTEALNSFLNDTGLELVGSKKFRKDAKGSENIYITEAIVMADSPLLEQTASRIRMRSKYSVNLVAVSRREKRIHKRLDHVVFKTGDVLMLQGRDNMLNEAIASMGCLPLAPRGLRIGYKQKIAVSLSIFAASIVLIIGGLLPVHVAFPMAAAGIVIAGILPVKEMYKSVDWPVIILLGAMLPVGEALEASGGAAHIAGVVLRMGESLEPWAILAIILIVTMFLSDIINNAATVVLMAPIAISIAGGMGYNADPLLMAVAIGGSSAFLTPIGHQSNTLVMGPGGYRFTDYWRMGLPLEIIIVAVGVPLIMFFWPL